MGMVGQLIERPSLLKTDLIPDVVKSICPKTSEEKRAVQEFANRHHKRGTGSRIRIVRGSAY